MLWRFSSVQLRFRMISPGKATVWISARAFDRHPPVDVSNGNPWRPYSNGIVARMWKPNTKHILELNGIRFEKKLYRILSSHSNGQLVVKKHDIYPSTHLVPREATLFPDMFWVPHFLTPRARREFQVGRGQGCAEMSSCQVDKWTDRIEGYWGLKFTKSHMIYIYTCF